MSLSAGKSQSFYSVPQSVPLDKVMVAGTEWVYV